MSKDSLQRAATLDRLQYLRDRGALDVEQHRQAAWLVAGPPAAEVWRRLLDVLALALGAALIVAGLAYVLIWNWGDLGRLTRISLACLPVLIATGVVGWKGTDGLVGKVTATAAAGCTLIPLAAVGVSYPSGGEAWPLMLVWAILCVPFALSARFTPAWFVVLLAADATLFTTSLHQVSVLAIALPLHAAAWAGFEVIARRDVPWVTPWSRHALLVPVLVTLCAFPMWLIFEEFNAVAWAFTAVFVVVSLGIQVAFMLRRAHPFPAVVNLVTVLVVLTSTMLRVIDVMDALGPFTLLPIGLLTLLLLIAGSAWVGLGLMRHARGAQ